MRDRVCETLTAERETFIVLLAEQRWLYLARDRGMALTLTVSGRQRPVKLGGAHADEVNALIDAGTLSLTDEELDWQGYIFVRVTSGWEIER